MKTCKEFVETFIFLFYILSYITYITYVYIYKIQGILTEVLSVTKYWKGRKFKVESKVNINNQKANTSLGLCEAYVLLEMRYGRRFDSFHFLPSDPEVVLV